MNYTVLKKYRNWKFKCFCYVRNRVVDLHSFFADLDPAVFLKVDSDRAAFSMRIRIQLIKLCKQLPYLMKSFQKLKKT